MYLTSPTPHDHPPDRIDAGYHRQDRRVHAREVVHTRCFDPVVVHVGHEATVRHGLGYRAGELGLDRGLEDGEDEVRELRDSRADEDEPGQESGQWHPVVQAEGRQGVEGRPDEREDHEKRPLRPADIEQPAHGGPEPGPILLDHVDLQRRHRQEESRKDDLGVERPSQIRLDPQDQRDQARSAHDDDRRQPDTSVAGSHRHRDEQHRGNHARDLNSFRRFHRVTFSCQRLLTMFGFPAAERGAVRQKGKTKGRILAAARKHFAASGYERATIRAIAAAVGVDPALVMRYFGNKEKLFAAAAEFDLRLPDLTAVPRGTVGSVLVGHFLDRWESDDSLQALLRAAVSHRVAVARLRAIFATAATRVGLVATQMLGMALCRYVLRLPPVMALDRAAVIEWLGPTIQHYLIGAKRLRG